MVINNAKFYRCLSNHNTGEFVGAALVDIYGPFQVSKVYAEDVEVVVPETNGGGDGVLLYQSGSAAIGKFRDIEVHRCHGRSGAAIFSSNGANLEAKGVRAYDCNVAQGVVYLGYNGDMDVSGVLVQGCRYLALTGSNRHAGGLAIFARINPAVSGGSIRDATYNISNVTLIDNDNDALSEGIELQNEHATSSVTATLNNVISRNNGTLEIKYLKTSGTGTFVVTTNNCNVLNGLAAIDSAGATTNTNNDLTSDDPVLNADGSLPDGSALSGIGLKWWSNESPIDSMGKPYPSFDIDIGGIQGSGATSHPFHPLNL
jgi:hypothetical protein